MWQFFHVVTGEKRRGEREEKKREKKERSDANG
jgi:hypothetical protein